MQSLTYGKITEQVCFNIINEFVNRATVPCTVAVGTDSQNIGPKLRLVTVITVHQQGKGGIFFFDVSTKPREPVVRNKIYHETQASLALAERLADYLQQCDIDVPFEVHVDVGTSGKSREVVKEIVGWVVGMGYVCKMKPEAYCSSGVADKLSKRDCRLVSRVAQT